jgi:hypothetical protein
MGWSYTSMLYTSCKGSCWLCDGCHLQLSCNLFTKSKYDWSQPYIWCALHSYRGQFYN